MGMPMHFALAFICAITLFVFASIRAAKVVCFFMGNDVLSDGTWRPCKEDLKQKRDAERFLRLSRFFIYVVIYIYLIKVKMLFSLMLTEQLKLLGIWYLSAIAFIYTFVFIVTNIITTIYMNKNIK